MKEEYMLLFTYPSVFTDYINMQLGDAPALASTIDLIEVVKHLDRHAVMTLEKYVKKLHLSNHKEVTEISEIWRARYSIITTKILQLKPYYPNADMTMYSKVLKTKAICNLSIENQFAQGEWGTDKERKLEVGDFTNRFLNLFDVKRVDFDEHHFIEIFEPDISKVNIWLEEFIFPPIFVEEWLEQNKLSIKVAAINTDYGVKDDTQTILLGKDKFHVHCYPSRSIIKEYFIGLMVLAYQVFMLAKGIKNYRYAVEIEDKQVIIDNKIEIHRSLYQEGVNSVLLHDCMESISRYEFKQCPSCKKYFFRNRRQRNCPFCKAPSLQTKAEFEESGLGAELLSNDFKRNAFRRKLSRIRPKLTNQEKNRMLVEAGFAPLNKTFRKKV